MKTQLKLLPFIVAVSLSSQASHAEIKPVVKKSATVVSSSIIGGLISGPVGFVVAGVGSALVADAVFDSEDELNADSESISNIAEAGDFPIAPVELIDFQPDSLANVEHDASAEEIVLSAPAVDDVEETLEQDSVVSINLLFDTNAFVVTKSLAAAIDSLTQAVSDRPNALVRVDGYTDPRGNANYNLALSERRAEAVASYLVASGVNLERIIIRAFGESAYQSNQAGDVSYADERKVVLFLDDSVGEDSQGEIAIDQLAKK